VETHFFFIRQTENRLKTDRKEIENRSKAINQTLFPHQQTSSSPRRNYLSHPFKQSFPGEQVEKRRETDGKEGENDSLDNIHPSTNILRISRIIPLSSLFPTRFIPSNKYPKVINISTGYNPSIYPHTSHIPPNPPYKPRNHLETHVSTQQQTLHKHFQSKVKQISRLPHAYQNKTQTPPRYPRHNHFHISSPSLKNEITPEKKNKSQK
jgi:hypothetical protein